jgi:hypothetical protein
VIVHQLKASYRQSAQSAQMNRFIQTHAGDNVPLSWLDTPVSATEGEEMEERCPGGEIPLWIQCKKGVTEESALEKVKEKLDEMEIKRLEVEEEKSAEDEKTEDVKEKLGKVKGVAVLYDTEDAACRKLCASLGWEYAAQWTYHGCEAEVRRCGRCRVLTRPPGGRHPGAGLWCGLHWIGGMEPGQEVDCRGHLAGGRVSSALGRAGVTAAIAGGRR